MRSPLSWPSRRPKARLGLSARVCGSYWTIAAVGALSIDGKDAAACIWRLRSAAGAVRMTGGRLAHLRDEHAAGAGPGGIHDEGVVGGAGGHADVKAPCSCAKSPCSCAKTPLFRKAKLPVLPAEPAVRYGFRSAVCAAHRRHGGARPTPGLLPEGHRFCAERGVRGAGTPPPIETKSVLGGRHIVYYVCSSKRRPMKALTQLRPAALSPAARNFLCQYTPTL